MGNKTKNKFVLEYLQKQLNKFPTATFIDLFAGGLNIDENLNFHPFQKIIINEIEGQIEYYKWLMSDDFEHYNFKLNDYRNDWPEYKKRYYNMCFTFRSQGGGYYYNEDELKGVRLSIDKTRQWLVQHKNLITFTSSNQLIDVIKNISDKSPIIIYMDPPYLGTSSVYKVFNKSSYYKVLEIMYMLNNVLQYRINKKLLYLNESDIDVNILKDLYPIGTIFKLLDKFSLINNLSTNRETRYDYFYQIIFRENKEKCIIDKKLVSRNQTCGLRTLKQSPKTPSTTTLI